MRPLHTILAATDHSPLATIGVEAALELARRNGARLHLVRVLGGHAEDWDELSAVDGDGVRVTYEVRRGDPAQQLAEAALASGAEMIVLASRGHGALRRAVLGSVASRLIRVSPVPVLVVGADRSKVEFESVVAAVDLSPIAREVLDVARSRVASGGSVRAFSFYEPEVVLSDGLLPYYPSPEDQERTQRLRVGAVRALIPDDGGPEVEIATAAEGPVASAILRAAEQFRADLVVAGTSGHNAWQRALLGSTVTRVLAEARCPVLIVPSHAEPRAQHYQTVTAVEGR